MTERFRTIAEPVVHETAKVKGSRFIAYLAPVPDAAAVDHALAAARREHPGASHHCLAARTGIDTVEVRFGDDGEPGGSAGRPMLMQLEGRDVTNVVAIVVRYFGGTKLGVGGLVRAYGGAVGEALDRADIHDVIVTSRVVVTFDYEQTGVVRGIVHELGLNAVAETFTDRVSLAFDLPLADVEPVTARFVDGTAGRADMSVDPPAHRRRGQTG